MVTIRQGCSRPAGANRKTPAIMVAKILPIPSIANILVDALLRSNPHRLFDMQVKQTRSVGADSFINADFARISNDQIGVSLTIVALSHLEETHDVASGIVTISEEVMTVPRTPPPEYHNAQISGVVQLELVVTPDGKTDKIKVVASPSTVLPAIPANAG